MQSKTMLGVVIAPAFLWISVGHSEPSALLSDGHANSAHWEYMGIEGPAHWGMLTREYMQCETGNRQSPINITMGHHGQHQHALDFHYHTTHVHEMNNGHTIQVSHVMGNQVTFNGRPYKLRQFHFHAPSEHHIEGNAFPMELHLVHQDARGHVLVVGVLLETHGFSSPLMALWNWLPTQMGQEVSIPMNFNLAALLPSTRHHFSYSGSLTTPPCTEGVQWIVLSEPVHITQVDVQRFVEIIGRNARPIQPLRGRDIETQ